MSDNLPILASQFPPDFTDKDQKLLSKFKDDGLPGISTVTFEMEKKMEQMYMEGYTYQGIAMETRQKKVHVLALASKYKWHDTRVERMSAMVESTYSRKDIFSAENQSFLISFCDSIREYYFTKIRQFKESKDPSVLDGMDVKLMGMYFKAFEALTNAEASKVGDGSKLPQQTLVNVQGNLNVGESAKSDADDLGKVLKALADLNRGNDTK
jgi:hypothetical protein